MATYITDEVVFEVPDGFVERSVNVLSSGNPQHPMSIVVNRDPQVDSLENEVAAQVAGICQLAKDTKIRGQRAREVGNLPAREVRMNSVAAKQPLYVRQTWVSYYGTMLSFTVTSLRAQQPLCDATADRLLANVKFRKR